MVKGRIGLSLAVTAEREYGYDPLSYLNLLSEALLADGYDYFHSLDSRLYEDGRCTIKEHIDGLYANDYEEGANFCIRQLEACDVVFFVIKHLGDGSSKEIAKSSGMLGEYRALVAKRRILLTQDGLENHPYVVAHFGGNCKISIFDSVDNLSSVLLEVLGSDD